MLSSNWLPLPWKSANDEGRVFRVTELAKSHGSAVAAWRQWDTSRADGDKLVVTLWRLIIALLISLLSAVEWP